MRATGERGGKEAAGIPDRKLLKVALRVLNALCIEQRQPEDTDEAYLREAAADKTTPLDELACQLIQRAVQRPRNQSRPKNARMGNRLPQFELTPREIEVLKLIAAGKSGKQIAKELGISFKTVVSHRSRVMTKLDIHDTSGLMRYARQKKLL